MKKVQDIARRDVLRGLAAVFPGAALGGLSAGELGGQDRLEPISAAEKAAGEPYAVYVLRMPDAMSKEQYKYILGAWKALPPGIGDKPLLILENGATLDVRSAGQIVPADGRDKPGASSQ